MQSIEIRGPIDGLTEEQTLRVLASLDRAAPLLLRLNSDGGSVQAGVAIFNALRGWPGGLTVEIDGWALSIASLILMAGTVRRIHPTGAVMVHAPWARVEGSAGELRQRADALDTVAASMRAGYLATGQKPAVIEQWLSGPDFWFTADDALAAGLVTEVIPADAAVVPEFANASACKHTIPEPLKRTIMAHHQQHTANEEAVRAQALAADRQRRADIRARFANWKDREGVQALLQSCEDDPQCTVQAAGQRLLDMLGRNTSPIQVGAGWSFNAGHDDRLADFRAAAVDTLLMRGGVKVVEPHPAARDLQRLSVSDMAERVLSMTGRQPTHPGRDGVIQAALGTSDFPLLLSNVTGKALAIGYEAAPSGHALISAERELQDFKPATLLNLSEAPGLLKVVEYGEYKHGTLTESATSFKVETFGRLLRLSRQALVNDDVGAFTALPASMGAAARRLEADLVFGALTANANMSDDTPLFHASRGNLATGAGSVLSVTSLAAARAAMRKQKSPGGMEYIDPQPAFLVVPVALETAAEQLVATLNDPTKSNDTPQPEWVRRLRVVADPRLDAISETAWYLTASPNQISTLVRGYLAGQPRPFLDSQEGFEVDALSWKTRLDFCVGILDFRGLFKSAGA